MRGVPDTLVTKEDFLESIHKYLCVVTDDSTFELWDQIKQVMSNTLDI
jgi:hypothetical protein